MVRKKIFKTVFASVLVLALGSAAVYNYLQTENYKRTLQYDYTRSLNDLRDCVDNISVSLDKAQYANTATEQNGLAAKLMRESSMAKAALSVLPTTGNSLDNMTKFITQVGDFSMALSKKVSQGYKISESEYKSMLSLEQYSQKLKKDLADAKPDFTKVNLTDSLKNTAQDFTNFPSMIYDGPFSDHVGRLKPKLTQGKETVLQGNAQNIAAGFLGLSQNELTHTQDSDGSMPTYNFIAKGGQIRVCVTKAGGYVSNMSDSRDITDEKMDYSDASKKAQAFLKSRGIVNMKESYYEINDGICIINFAYTQGNVICYPDLVKVGVALDNGEIVRFQSTGYIMNHTNRSLAAKLTRDQAAKNVSSILKIQQGRLALIPTPGLNEVLCYEFLCTGKNNEQVLVYINAKDGYEEDILILQKSGTGVLAR